MCKRGRICFVCLSQVWRRNLLILVVDPQRRRMFLLVRRFYYYLLNFQLFRKGSHTEGMLFIFPCSLAFFPQMFSRRIWMLSLSLPPSEFSRFTCLPPVWPPHLPACPACPACPPALDSATVAAFHFVHACGTFCLIYPSAACQEEPRSCITSPYLPRVFCRMPSLCSKTPNEPPKTVSVDKFQRRAGEGSATR